MGTDRMTWRTSEWTSWSTRWSTIRWTIWWTLRVAAGMCFVGHGAFGLITKEDWVPFFALAGLSRDRAYTLMPVIGLMDIALGLMALLLPTRAALAYMTAWAVWTAALRPLTGLSVFEMLERAGNYGVPLALLVWVGLPLARDGWWKGLTLADGDSARVPLVRTVLALTTALLLAGHGGLALLSKPLLVAHAAAIGLPASAVPLAGAFELVLAALVLVAGRPLVLAGVCGWKVATEALFIVSGAPVWEFIERGGSYGAPLALAMLLAGPVSRDAGATVTSGATLASRHGRAG